METKNLCLKVIDRSDKMYYEQVLKILFVCYLNCGDYDKALKCLN